MRLPRNVCFYFPLLRERLKGNADDDRDDEIAEQPMEKIKLEEVENDTNDQVGVHHHRLLLHAVDIAKKVKAVYSASWETHLRATGRHLTYRTGSHSVTRHPTQVNAPRLNPSQTGRYSIYLPRRDGRLSRPR